VSTTGELLTGAWIWQPGAALVLVAAVALYLARFGARRPGRLVALAGAAAVAVIAVMSPVAVLARSTLFSAHMLQHMLLALVVPPLAIFALPRTTKRSEPDRRRGRWPWAASWLAGVGAMWRGHAPALCNAAATSDLVRGLQNLSLPALGAAFWWPILGPRRDQRLSEPGAVAYLFTACAACTVLGVAITFSPVTVCSAYGHAADPLGALPLVRGSWGLTPAVDQQLGGLLMWVPGCTAYAGAILAIIARFYGAPHGEATRTAEAPEAP
jgi:cytochrome c oxidase assembly factor CtaG